jgi:hypothetical protein
MAASPITYNFAGQWNFNDPQVDTPDFWAAMNNVGVYNGTAFTWSMTLDSAVPGEVTSDFKISNLEYTFTANTASPDPTQGFFWAGLMNGNTLQGPLLTYLPEFLQYGNVLPVGPLVVGDVGWFVFAFNSSPGSIGSAQFQNNTQVTLRSIEKVPEASTLVALAGGLIAFVPFARALRRRRAANSFAV